MAEGADIVCDLRSLKLSSESVDVCAAIHVIEHFKRWEVPAILEEWRRVLKVGGKLVLELPCLDKMLGYAVWAFKNGLDISKGMFMHGMFGDPKYKRDEMTHRWAYSTDEMIQLLREAGFRAVIHKDPNYHFPMRDIRYEALK